MAKEWARIAAAWGLAAAALGLIGCGQTTAQVSGTARFRDGSPLQGEIRVIRFEPAQDTTAKTRKAAFADIEEDGSFEMLTRQPGDGVYLGKYHVTFTVFKTAMGQESAIPAKYTTAAETPFTIDVTRNVQDLLFELDKE